VFAGYGNNALDDLGTIGGSNRGRLLEEPGWWSDGRFARLAEGFLRIGHRQQVRVRVLHAREILRSGNCPPQTPVVKLIGGGARRAPGKIRANRNNGVLFLHILMDDVVSEASEGEAGPGKDGFDLVGGRVAANAVEEVSGLFSGQH